MYKCKIDLVLLPYFFTTFFLPFLFYFGFEIFDCMFCMLKKCIYELEQYLPQYSLKLLISKLLTPACMKVWPKAFSVQSRPYNNMLWITNNWLLGSLQGVKVLFRITLMHGEKTSFFFFFFFTFLNLFNRRDRVCDHSQKIVNGNQ